ncbi:MAG: L-histidine N(alpha)-methyltransferase [Bacteroidales bacterium]|nr:L-histidine N(alpha)-methyltransferase [Bacteroidales bacterium]
MNSKIEKLIIDSVKKVLSITTKISLVDNLINLGIDSVHSVTLTELINQKLGTNIGVELIYDSNSIKQYIDNIQKYLKKGVLEDLQEKVDTTDKSNLKEKEKSSMIVFNANDKVEIEDLKTEIYKQIESLLTVDKKAITGKSFFELGFDSVSSVDFIDKLNNALSINIGIEVIYDYNKIDDFINYITKEFENRKKKTEQTNVKLSEPEDNIDSRIAVVGMSGRFPGADSIDEFWSNLVNGVCSVKEIQRDGFEVTNYFSSKLEEKNKSISKWAGLMRNIKSFDASFFQISPREAERMDPQQRILLEECYHAMEDAGYSEEVLKNKEVAVFVGARNSDYINTNVYNNTGIESQMFLGRDMGIASGRISYFSNFTGPCLTVDTACSSGLVAVHYAINSLMTGESDIALAASVFTIPSPNFLIETSKSMMLSPDGCSRTFDNKANGIALGESCVSLVLKPYNKAVKDNDNIHAVILGSAVNQDGTTYGITAPSARSQEKLILSTLKKANVSPSTINYVEAHGTGTKLGDPIEVKALINAYTQKTEKKQFCYLGSHKPNIGHTITSAGMCGLVKSICVLKHETVPYQLYYSEQNEHFSLENSPFRIPMENVCIENNGNPLRVAVSSFGFSGTNSHVILEQFKPEKKHVSEEKNYILPFSAKDGLVLQKLIINFYNWLKKNKEDVALQDIVRTLQFGRNHFSHRETFIVNSLKQAIRIIGRYLENIGENTKNDVNQNNNKVANYVDKKLYETSLQYEKGNKINWLEINPMDKARFISLPTYPFIKNDYWLEFDGNYFKNNIAFNRLYHSKSEETACKFKVSGSEGFVKDHEIDGYTILPAAYYIIMLKDNLQSGNYLLNDLTLLQSCKLASNEDIILKSKYIEESDKWVISNNNGSLRFVECVVQEFSDGKKTQSIKLYDKKKGFKFVKSKRDFYNMLAKSQARYGESLQVIKELYYKEDELFAELSINHGTYTSENARKITILDSALHSLLWFSKHLDQVSKPFHIGEIYLNSSLIRTKYLEASKKDEKYHLNLYSEDGKLTASLKDIYLKTSPREKSFHIIKPYWQRINSDALAEKRAIEEFKTKKLLVAGDRITDSQLDFLSKNNSGSVIYIKTEKGIFNYINSNKKTLSSEKIEDLGELDCVYYIQPSLEEDYQEIANLESKVVYNAIQRFFELVKSLSPYYKENIDFNVLLLNSKQLQIVENPVLSVIKGFVKSLSKEFSTWKVRTWDIDLNFDEKEECFDYVNLFNSYGSGEYLIREKLTYKQQLLDTELLVQDDILLKENGIYVIVGGTGGIGFELANRLIDNYNAKVVLLGRSKPEKIKDRPEIKACLLTPKMFYYQCDVSDSNQLDETLKTIIERIGDINGIVHSALVLEDRTIQSMDRQSLMNVLQSKVEGTINLCQQGRKLPLDFMLFFSSCQSFTGSYGQSNYSAASQFQDSYIQAMQQYTPFPLKLINWGYWGTIGVVAGKEYQNIMASQGIYSIIPEEGMQVIEKILSTSLNRVLAINSTYSALEDMGYSKDLYFRQLPHSGAQLSLLNDDVLKINKVSNAINQELVATAKGIEMLTRKAFDTLDIIYEKLTGHNNKAGRRWTNLFDQGIIHQKHIKLCNELDNLESSRDNPIDIAEVNVESPSIQPYYNLIHTCLDSYSDILTGNIAATDVMFPNGSLELVQGIYSGNNIADYYTDLIAEIAVQLIDSNDQKVFKIVEIGSGTGSTTRQVCEKLSRYDVQIQYIFTDISTHFLTKAKEKFGREFPNLEFKHLDIEKEPLDQGFNLGDYNMVIATNVLHATTNIGNTIRNIKKLLVSEGVLLINEMTKKQDFLSLTFGLLDGWWLSQDKEIREEGSPILSTLKWFDVLKQEGYINLQSKGEIDNIDDLWSQRIIIAQSNGEIKLQNSREIAGNVQFEQPTVETHYEDPSNQDYVLERILEVISNGTGMPSDQITLRRSFSELGIDSIVGVEIVDKLNQTLGVKLKNTVFFNYPNLEELNKHITSTFDVKIPQIPENEPDFNEIFHHVQNSILESVIEVSGIEKEKIDFSKDFVQIGIDSISGVELINKINLKLGIRLTAIVLFNYNNLDQLVKHIETKYGHMIVPVKKQDIPQINDQTATLSVNEIIPFKQEANKERIKDNDIAIIGMSGRFADYENLQEFWEGILDGRNSIREVPQSRWDVSEFYDEDVSKLDKTNSKWCGSVNNIELFDPQFFSISGNEAKYIDPQQRLFLEESYKALEDAGYTGTHIDKLRCGVYAGCMEGDYIQRLRNIGAKIEPQAFWGNDSSILASRVSYFMNLKGPCVTLNTACSSSLVALHQACSSILSGETDIALAGGVYVSTTPQYYILSSNANMFAPDGQCKTFDDKANGFVLGEGCGVVVVKSLKEAKKDNDHIYAVIKSSGINQDGKTNGITAPSGIAQKELEIETLNKAGISAETINYVEAHGTGTRLGDPIEIDALSEAFQEFTTKKQFCGIGSVKTNIGHLAAASGIAGIIKIVMSLNNKILPPTTNFNSINNNIEIENTPFYILNKKTKWEKDSNMPRRAAVSSFGFSGTNAHFIIDEWIENQNDANKYPDEYVAIPFSGKSEDRLTEYIENFIQYLQDKSEDLELNKQSENQSNKNTLLRNVACTLQLGRKHEKFRFLVLANDIAGLLKSLKSYHKSTDKLVNINQVSADKQFLLKKWLNGEQINWNENFKPKGANKISLPTSVFIKDRYWVEGKYTNKNRNNNNSQTANKDNFIPMIRTNDEKVWYFSEEWQAEKSVEQINSEGIKNIIVFYNPQFEPFSYCQKYKAKHDNSINFIFVKCSTFYKKYTENEYSIEYSNESNLDKLLQDIKLYSNESISIVNLTGIITQSTEVYDDALFYLRLIKSLNRNIQLSKIQLLHAFTDENNIQSAQQKALLGLGKTIQLENSNITLKVLSIKSDSLQNKSAYFNTEKGSVINDIKFFNIINESLIIGCQHIKLENNIRYIQKWYAPNHYVQPHKSISLKVGGTYIITGGFGGIGILLCKYIAENYKANIVVIGRSEIDIKKQSLINDLEAKGARVLYKSTDISNIATTQQVIQESLDRFGNITGVIHCAGTIKSGLLINKPEEEFKNVLDSKVKGVLALHYAIGMLPIEFFAVFSSISSLLGTNTKGDYSYGNSFLNHFACWRNHESELGNTCGKTISVLWSLWLNGGMEIDSYGINYMKETSGIIPLSDKQGIEAFKQVLTHNNNTVAVIPGEKDKITKSLNRGLVQQKEQIKSNNTTFEISDIDSIENTVKEICAELFDFPINRIDSKANFEDLGIDSIFMIKMLDKLEKSFNINIDSDSIYSNPNVKKLSQYLLKIGAQAKTSQEVSKETPIETSYKTKSNNNIKSAVLNDKVAIIGTSLCFPGASSLDQFWENLYNGKELFSQVNFDRWDNLWQDHKIGKTYTVNNKISWGGFIDDIESFDAGYFKLSSEEATLIDPHQRKILSLADNLFNNAGYTKEELSGKLIDVIIGGGDSSYVKQFKHLIPEDQYGKVLVSMIPNMISARISDFYNLKGSAQTVESACSSSLVALDMACQNILSGKSEMAVAGGVKLLLDPFELEGFEKAGIISPTSKIKVFDKNADGCIFGEGAGLVMLKNYNKAVEEGDNILAVICGTGINNDGKTMGITVPSIEGQKEVIKMAIENSGVNPQSVRYFEAHGTGTMLGDPIEIKAAKEVYELYTKNKHFCAVGSVKSNFGHLLQAGGIAGLLKASLVLNKRTIVPTLNCTEPHPRFGFNNSPFYPALNIEKIDGRGEFHAAVSAFGFGGTNAHIILQSFTPELNSNYKRTRFPLPDQKNNNKKYWLNKQINEPAETFDYNLLTNEELLEKLSQGLISVDLAEKLIN